MTETQWGEYVDEVFVAEIQTLRDVVMSRLMPGLDGLDGELNSTADAAWEAHQGDLLEVSSVLGPMIWQWERLKGIRQGMLNLFTVALRHLFDQQLELLRQRWNTSPIDPLGGLLDFDAPGGEAPREEEFRNLADWPVVNELRLVSNTVKHAEGRSAVELRSIRPDIFAPPELKGRSAEEIRSLDLGDLIRPLLGEDLFVSTADLERYFSGVKRFWGEVASLLVGRAVSLDDRT